MSILFRRVAILGLGLLGGSVALASRRRAVVETVAAASRRLKPLQQALADGLVDEIGQPEEVVRGADLIVLATPIGKMRELVERVAPSLKAGALVTDVGSVKGELADSIPGLLPAGVTYVGAHPMAGSHERGVRHASQSLFEGAPCVVMRSHGAEAEALEKIVVFWQALGAQVIVRGPASHDEEVAWVSHAPHALAFAYAHALRKAPNGAEELAGSGFRDFTRIARSDPGLWSEIFEANGKALAGAIQAFGESLTELAQAVEAGDREAQHNFLASARDALDGATAGSIRAGSETLGNNARSDALQLFQDAIATPFLYRSRAEVPGGRVEYRQPERTFATF